MELAHRWEVSVHGTIILRLRVSTTTTRRVTGSLITVPPEAVENFTLLSNQFNAEFGHSSGGQFNTTVKSGTNSFHGSAYEYFRNRNLNAVDQTWVQQGLTTNPRFDANRFGGTLGGPIIKNKLFFFTNFERNPVGFISVGGGAVQAPTAAGLAAMNADPNLNATNFGIFQTYVPLATTPSGCITYNGTTNSGATKIGTTPYSAPANGTCGAGTVEVGNVPIVPAAWQSWTNFVQSVDYNMSDKDQIRGRFIYNKENLLDNAAQLGTFFAPYSITFALVNASEYHTFSPSVTNEFRVGYNRFDENIPAGNFKYPGIGCVSEYHSSRSRQWPERRTGSECASVHDSELLSICRQRQHRQGQTQLEGRGRVPLVYFTAGLHPTIAW